MQRLHLYIFFSILFLALFFLARTITVSAPTLKKAEIEQDKPPSPKKKEADQSISVKVVAVKWPKKKLETPSPNAKKKRPLKQEKPGSQKPKTEKNGNWQIVGHFDCNIGFYIEQMRQKGAKLVVYERTKGSLFEFSEKGHLRHIKTVKATYSATSRRITDDFPESAKLISMAEKKFGSGRYEIVLLMPQHLENHIKQTLVKIVTQKTGVSEQSINAITVSYKKMDSQLAIELDHVVAGTRKIKIKDMFVL